MATVAFKICTTVKCVLISTRCSFRLRYVTGHKTLQNVTLRYISEYMAEGESRRSNSKHVIHSLSYRRKNEVEDHLLGLDCIGQIFPAYSGWLCVQSNFDQVGDSCALVFRCRASVHKLKHLMPFPVLSCLCGTVFQCIRMLFHLKCLEQILSNIIRILSSLY